MNRFSNRVVRDLAWVIASPPLVSGQYNDTHWWNHADCLNEFNDCLPSLQDLDTNPAPLIEHLAQLNSQRLGLRFESFIAYWITISPNYELLTQNLQLIEKMTKGSHTLGEIDFIILDLRTDKIIHLEVAVKFYLGTQPQQDPMKWFGTNTKDQLGKKVEHLKHHQTQLSLKYPENIQNHGYIIDYKQCLLKGRLFYPLDNNTQPRGVTDNHLRGRWTQSPQNYISEQLYPLDKIDWLSVLSKEDLKNKNAESGFKMEDRARCYVHATKENNEIERVFRLPSSFSFP